MGRGERKAELCIDRDKGSAGGGEGRKGKGGEEGRAKRRAMGAWGKGVDNGADEGEREGAEEEGWVLKCRTCGGQSRGESVRDVLVSVWVLSFEDLLLRIWLSLSLY